MFFLQNHTHPHTARGSAPKNPKCWPISRRRFIASCSSLLGISSRIANLTCHIVANCLALIVNYWMAIDCCNMLLATSIYCYLAPRIGDGEAFGVQYPCVEILYPETAEFWEPNSVLGDRERDQSIGSAINLGYLIDTFWLQSARDGHHGRRCCRRLRLPN